MRFKSFGQAVVTNRLRCRSLFPPRGQSRFSWRRTYFLWDPDERRFEQVDAHDLAHAVQISITRWAK